MFKSIPQSRMTSLIYFFLLLMFSACGGATSVQYFTIALPSPVREADEAAKLPDYLAVKQLDSGVMYHEDRLIYHDAQNEIKHWNYKKWIAPPAVLMTEALKRHLTRANIFYNVLDYPASIRTRYQLEGKLNSFEERDTAQSWSVHVGLELRLFDSEKQKFIWEKALESTQPVRTKTIAGVVAGFAAASAHCIESAVREIKTVFENQR